MLVCRPGCFDEHIPAAGTRVVRRVPSAFNINAYEAYSRAVAVT